MGKRLRLIDLIEAGIITPPFKVYCCFKKHEFVAEIDQDGFLMLEGKRYTSLSVAAGVVRAKISGKPKDGLPYRRANGWTFWSYLDKKGQLQKMDNLREEFLG